MTIVLTPTTLREWQPATGHHAVRLHRRLVAVCLLSVCCWTLLAGQSLVIAQSLPGLPTGPTASELKLIAALTSPEPSAAVATEESPTSASTGMFLGSLSCASASCHGNPRRESVLGSAAHFFLDRDTHQLAGEVLRGQRSREMAARLNLPRPAWKTRECLACHAPAAMDVADRKDFPVKLAEGVGCESCHGPAREWLGPHHTREWKQSAVWSGDQKARAGFHDTKDLPTRVGVCADCHVGNASQYVSHDFIAAGHPRLAFEYSAFQSQMPVHWRRADDRKRSPVANSEPSSDRSTYEAKNWLIGQLVTADHELDILSAAAGNSKSVWPELAQYDCFGCHHDLSAPSWRQARTAWKLGPGELPWGTWSFGLLAETERHLPAVASRQIASDQAALRTAMRTASPDKARALALIAEMRPKLADTSRQLSQSSFTAADITSLRDALLADHATLTMQGWDRAAQLYLAAVALDKGAADARGDGNRVDPARREAFLRLRELLSYCGSKNNAVPPFDHHDSPYLLDANWPEIRRQIRQLQLRSSDNSSNRPARANDAAGQRESATTPPASEME